MSPKSASRLISPAQLAAQLLEKKFSLTPTPRTVPLSAAWFLPNDPQSRTGLASFTARRIPGSRFFDLDAVSNTSSPYPHMLPTAPAFARAMTRLGIRRDDAVVVYDTAELGLFSAPRVAWTLRVFGHANVQVLNSFRAWVEQGFDVEGGEPSTGLECGDEAVEYAVPEMDGGLVVGFDEMRERVRNRGKEKGVDEVQVLDARPEARWKGTAEEPRKGLSSGHMPGSISLPHTALLDASGAMLPAAQLRRIFKAKGVRDHSRVISSCGSGVTAAVVDLALAEAGYSHTRVYDGSWTEWAQRVDPGEKLIVKEDDRRDAQ